MSGIDLLNYAGAFANIVGLIGMFKTEHQQNHLENQYDAFLEWLEENHHQDMLNAIQQNQNLINSLKILLQNNHDELMVKIEKIDTLLLEISSNINGFEQLATSFSSRVSISEQAKSILYQLYISGGSCCMEHKIGRYIELIILDSKGNNRIELNEPQFLEEDLEHLDIYGLLRVDLTSKGTRQFYLTRLGVKLVS